MEKTIKHSLTLTIGLVVILIETAAFFAVGFFYTQRFSAELDAAALGNVEHVAGLRLFVRFQTIKILTRDFERVRKINLSGVFLNVSDGDERNARF